MYLLQAIECKLGRHHWGPLEGDNWGGFHTCTYCKKSKRLTSDHRADAHDHLEGGH
jgi:hypothetical protein